MGGFSSQVQQPQASQPTSGKGGVSIPPPAQNILAKPDQISQAIPESVAQPAVMPPGGGGKGAIGQPAQNTPMPQQPQGGGKGQRNYEQRPGSFRDDTNYAPPDGTMGGKGASTNSATSGQPRMGQPNRYANTIPQWDNASQQLAPAKSGGKGKGG
jgi:hypothetical protein